LVLSMTACFGFHCDWSKKSTTRKAKRAFSLSANLRQRRRRRKKKKKKKKRRRRRIARGQTLASSTGMMRRTVVCISREVMDFV